MDQMRVFRKRYRATPVFCVPELLRQALSHEMGIGMPLNGFFGGIHSRQKALCFRRQFEKRVVIPALDGFVHLFFEVRE
jgi:hypothetical protein